MNNLTPDPINEDSSPQENIIATIVAQTEALQFLQTGMAQLADELEAIKEDIMKIKEKQCNK